MKIALITFLWETRHGGGAASAVRQLAFELQTQGHQVVVITTQRARGISVEREAGVKVIRFRPLNFYWVAEKDDRPVWLKVLWQLIDVWNPHTWHVVRQILRSEEVDVVHVQKLRGLSPAVWRSAGDLGLPVVQTTQDYELVSPEGTLTGRLGPLARSRHPLLRWYQVVRASLSRNVDALTAPSHFTLDQIRHFEFFPQVPGFVVPNPHDQSEAQIVSRLRQPKTGRHSPEKTHVLYLGRLEHTKGVDLLCEAFQMAHVQARALQLSIVGWGTLGETLKRRFAGSSSITFHGPLFGKEKTKALLQHDLLVAPSVWDEVFGIVIVDGYAHGLPAMVSGAGGMPELVEEGETGFIVPRGDRRALVNQLVESADRIDEIRGMRRACLSKAMNFTAHSVGKQYLDIYQRVIGGS